MWEPYKYNTMLSITELSSEGIFRGTGKQDLVRKEHVRTLRLTLEQSAEWNTKDKAFDSLNRDSLETSETIWIVNVIRIS